MRKVEFTEDFATKKAGEVFTCDTGLASQLVHGDKVAKYVDDEHNSASQAHLKELEDAEAARKAEAEAAEEAKAKEAADKEAEEEEAIRAQLAAEAEGVSHIVTEEDVNENPGEEIQAGEEVQIPAEAIEAEKVVKTAKK